MWLSKYAPRTNVVQKRVDSVSFSGTHATHFVDVFFLMHDNVNLCCLFQAPATGIPTGVVIEPGIPTGEVKETRKE
jgi:hypothetical protein